LVCVTWRGLARISGGCCRGGLRRRPDVLSTRSTHAGGPHLSPALHLNPVRRVSMLRKFAIAVAAAAVLTSPAALAPKPAAPAQVAEEATAKLAQTSRYKEDEIAFFAKVRPQFTALTPPDSSETVTFVESSEGLPQSGSWRNSLAVADMNGDGFLDLVTPPE